MKKAVSSHRNGFFHAFPMFGMPKERHILRGPLNLQKLLFYVFVDTSSQASFKERMSQFNE
jgi:hypothetical protein